MVGKTAVFKGTQPAIYAGYLIRIRCSDELLPDYLNYCLNSPAGHNWRWRVKSDSVSQSNINAKKLAAFQFELPPIEEQQEIIRRTTTLFAYADRVDAHCQAAQTQVKNLIPALLSKAFRGELVPQDPNDEPASALLERIQTARTAMPAKPRRGSNDRKTKRTKMNEETVKEVIYQLPNNMFSFEEMREKLAGDYDTLKDIVFGLLGESEPTITQIFDETAQTIRFVRSNK